MGRARESTSASRSGCSEIIPNSHILDQYSNPSNPLAHEDGTGREIIDQCGGKLDAVVMTAGTGGTITGVAQGDQARGAGRARSSASIPRARSSRAPARSRRYKVEGIGYDFIPDVLDRRLVDGGSSRNDRDSFLVARQLIRQEGLLDRRLVGLGGVGGDAGRAATSGRASASS